MSLNTSVSALILAGVLSGSVGAKGIDNAHTEDGRICGQPFAGGIIQVACANIAGIIESQGGISNVQFVPTRDGKQGEQFNQINTIDGKPLVIIYTPPNKYSKK